MQKNTNTAKSQAKILQRPQSHIWYLINHYAERIQKKHWFQDIKKVLFDHI